MENILRKEKIGILDVANVILFLMSDKSDAIRGQNIVVDNGYTIV
ncbi:SDR family oxidoreductase [Bacillus cereus]|nr:SDR family oxidoreductase [Bacillus cereus]